MFAHLGSKPTANPVWLAQHVSIWSAAAAPEWPWPPWSLHPNSPSSSLPHWWTSAWCLPCLCWSFCPGACCQAVSHCCLRERGCLHLVGSAACSRKKPGTSTLLHQGVPGRRTLGPHRQVPLTSRAVNSVFLARNPRLQFFFWLPKRVNRDISCIATKVRKLQIYPFSFQHTRLEYRPPLASKIQMEIHDTHIYVEHIYIYAYCTSPGPIWTSFWF